MKKKIQIQPVNTKDAAKRLGKPGGKKVARTTPFRKGTAIAEAFELCKKGCSPQQFDSIVAKFKCDKYRLLRVLRKESAYGFTWKWSEKDKYRVSHVS